MTRERIASAAVRVNGRVFLGTSHKVAVLVAANSLGVEPQEVWSEMAAGFTTTAGRFVSRAKAWKIAKREGQLRWDRSRSETTPELHSEDLA